MGVFAHTVYVIDFEGSRKTGVLEFGVVTLEAGKVAATRTQLCAPTGALDARESRVHKLTEEMLAGQPPFSAHFDEFKALRQEGFFAAHNASVERRLLCDVWPHPGLVPDFEGSTFNDWGPWLDTCALYRKLYPQLPEHALGALLKRFCLLPKLETLAALHCPIGRNKAHCALYDALGAALLLLRLAEEPLLGGLSPRQLLSMANPFAGNGDNQPSLL